MALFLVRHAKAGHRGFGPQDDQRELSPDGHSQAKALRGLLSDTPVSRLLSSPFARCRQTLEPLAESTGLAIESMAILAEAQPFEPVLALFDVLPENSVLCSHGDLIPDVMQALVRRGLVIHGQEFWNKGSVWILDRIDGAITDARALRL